METVFYGISEGDILRVFELPMRDGNEIRTERERPRGGKFLNFL